MARALLDEASLRFHDVSDESVEDALDELSECLSSLLKGGTPVAKFSLILEFECRTGIPLYSLLYERASSISHDTLRRFSDLLQRCSDWDSGDSDATGSCVISGRELGEAWTLSHAALSARGRLLACISASTAGRQGLQQVRVGAESASLYFLCEPGRIPEYWQSAMKHETVPEQDFFSYATRAFTGLAFHPDLAFRSFTGSYPEVYAWAVDVLIAVNEHFESSCNERHGVRDAIMVDMRAHGIDASPESPKTHGNAQAMQERRVAFEGEIYTCEWHAKRLWNVDRIHFSTPGALADGRILIGLFTSHLET